MRSKLLQEILDETPEESKIFAQKYAALMVRIEDLLNKKGWSQKKLAKNMGQKPSTISRWLNGRGNLTLRSIAKLEAELGEILLTIPKSNPKETEWEGSEVTAKINRKKTRRNPKEYGNVDFKDYPLKKVA